MRKGSALDRTFYVSLILKALDSALETLGGVILLLVSPATVGHITKLLTENELSTDPHDFIANHILHAAREFTHGGRWFAAFYLLSHGLVKIVIIIALFKQKLWAYPWMMGVLGLFIVYQVYRMTFKFGFGLLFLTVFDAFVIWLTWLEYKKHKGLQAQNS